MVAAMAGFALEDMILKSAAQSLPIGQVMVIVGLIGMATFAALARARGEAALHPAMLSRPLLIRGLCEVTGRLFYALALALTPLSQASAILQATPLVVVAGAALIWGERVGARRWAAILVGLAGVLVILRPGLAGFEPLSVLAVLGMLGFAGRDLATRAAPASLGTLQLGVSGFGMLTVAGTILLGFTGGAVWPQGAEWPLLGAGAVCAVLAYSALTRAMRTGEVSAVTPFRYTRLVFAMILGTAVFGERPDGTMLLGSALVIGAGLSVLIRRRSAPESP